MRVQNRFDLHRVDILSEADDQFLGSANDKKRAVLKTGKVTCVEPSLSINRCSFLLRRMIVAFHDVGTADPHPPRLSVSNWPLIGSDQLDLHPWEHLAHRGIRSMLANESLGNVW